MFENIKTDGVYVMTGHWLGGYYYVIVQDLNGVFIDMDIADYE